MISLATKFVYRLALILFGRDNLKHAYLCFKNPGYQLSNFSQKFAFQLLKSASSLGFLKPFERFHSIGNNNAHGQEGMDVFSSSYLNIKLNRIYNLPDVEVDETRAKTINILVPAFEFKSISAGFFGVFKVALFLKKTNFQVRLVLFDNFYFNFEEFKHLFKDYPGMENIFDELEVEYIGDRINPLKISPNDTCVATVWYSAYFAQKIMNQIGGRKFVYLIQDYETNFYPGGSLFIQADMSYRMNYTALFSTQALQAHFVQNNIGGINDKNLVYTYFNNASACHLPEKSKFIENNTNKAKKKLVFYSRPIVDRNMFELTALVLCEAYKQGIFNSDEWECIGMGLGGGVVELLPGLRTTNLPRMTLKEYTKAVGQFDLCLTLMASPHPSLIPMDLGGSGAIVVTNTLSTKTPDYLASICKNIIGKEPNLYKLVDGLREAKDRVNDLEKRYLSAEGMNYPVDWDNSLTDEHLTFFNEHLREFDQW